jgi:hypothetical protein
MTMEQALRTVVEIHREEWRQIDQGLIATLQVMTAHCARELAPSLQRDDKPQVIASSSSWLSIAPGATGSEPSWPIAA